MDYLSTLNEKQLEAVLATEGYLRVIAGAGSGKTKLLVSRYAYLVKEYGIDPANILCVTFTNKAAGEMKRRIRAIIGQEYDTSLICTYHGFCVKVLREDIEKVFYPKEFQIIDNSQQKAMLGEIYQKFELKLDHASFEKIMKSIAVYKAKNDYVSKMCCRDKCQIMKEFSSIDDQIIEEYMQRQKRIFAMDFSDLMHFTIYLFEHFPEILQKWKDRLNYIQVDEFQDTSKTEMKLVEMLSEVHNNLMIVGDPDQNIYEWRGSDVKLLVDFDKHHTPTNTVFLNQNYRSTPEILRCANVLIDNNQCRLKKDLFTKGESGKPVYHYHTKNEYDEADKIIENIQAVRKSTRCNYADFAVLYRSGFLSRIIEKRFTEEGIPYEIFGGVKFYHRMEIQDIMAYLRLVAFDDDISFKRVVNKPRRRFGRTKMQHLMALSGDDKTLYETLKENINDPVFKNSGAVNFIEMIESLRQEHIKISLPECVEKICADSGYEKYIRELGDMERFENLSEFKRIASEYEKNFGENVTLKEFINQISLQSEDDGEKACDMVKLMTIHAAKGLEFPNVFVIGFSEGIFPSSKTIEERKEKGLEEERRLCYVAITRAEKQLFLLDSEGYTQNGRQKLPSRFLKEIGEENYIRIGSISKELQQQADNYAKNLLSETIDEIPLSIGSTVSHPVFGEGIIVDYGKNKNSFRIRFDKISGYRDISADFFNRVHKPLPTMNMINHRIEKPDEKPQQTPVEKISDTTSNNNGYEKVEEKKITTQKRMTSGSQKSEPVNDTQKKPDVSESDNLWNRDDVPKSNWSCVGVTDLGEPAAICEMCGHQIIRYVHHMVHPEYSPLDVGCICAGKMEGDIKKAQKREQDFKSKEARKQTFLNKKWKQSKNNNSYLKIRDHLIVLYYNKNYNNWKYSIDGVFCKEVYPTREEAMSAAFEALEKVIE